jgi:hypothetical protein
MQSSSPPPQIWPVLLLSVGLHVAYKLSWSAHTDAAI